VFADDDILACPGGGHRPRRDGRSRRRGEFLG
jgi:hypothetical protein